jgi:hypothetical protein
MTLEKYGQMVRASHLLYDLCYGQFDVSLAVPHAMVLGTMMVSKFCQLPRIIVVMALVLIYRNLTKCFCAGF